MTSTPGKPVRVALIEDHTGTRNAFMQVLGDFKTRVELVTTAPHAEDFLKRFKALDLQVVLVDLNLPGVSGIELIRGLSESSPQLRSVALTTFEDETTVVDAVRAGAHGYLLKDEPPERLVRAIEEAAAGEHPVSSRVAGFLLLHARRAPPPVALSDREEELATALAEGLTYSECAPRMGIGLGTVQDYVKRIYRKLDINSKKEVREWVARYANR